MLTMEDLQLSETEWEYFSDLFQYCDEESIEQIPLLKATELFRSSNLSNEVIKQIMDISLAPASKVGLKHINKKQFFSALKLIAAYQSNIPLKPEVLTKKLELPVPKFNWTFDSPDLVHATNNAKEYHFNKRSHNNVGNYEPIRLLNFSDVDIPSSLSHNNTEAHSTDSEVESETLSLKSDHSRGRRVKNGSPWSTESDSPTPTNSVAEAQPNPVWENSATGRGVWPSNTTEEHTQLLGTEEESSDRHSSDEETNQPILMTSITEQHTHIYLPQFTSLQPDSRGLLPGHVARPFFEKSQLSLTDLRKIWQLADVDGDGALDLTEFTIAMLLIAARRNDEVLPDELPPNLMPKVHLAPPTVAPPAAPPTADLLDLGSGDYPSVPDMAEVEQAEQPTSFSQNESHSARVWTKFSPTSDVSSPGPKPVNFDFHRSSVERDPNIAHPVALRVTPEGARRKEPPPPPPRPRATHARSSSLDLAAHTRSGSLDLERLRPAPPPRTSPPRSSPPAPPASVRRHGAFEVYRKEEKSDAEDARSLAEQNSALKSMCRALETELNDVRRERNELQAKLDSIGQ